MDPRKMNALDAAVKVGEESTTLAIRHGLKIMQLQRAMWQALNQLRRGLPDRARRTLEEALKSDDRKT
jgi:hypothetical protein